MIPTEKPYREAWERLKAGKQNIVDKNIPINELNTVALEANKKKGSLRKNNLPDLCDEILNYEVKETAYQECIRKRNDYREEVKEKAKLWTNALARELMLKKRLYELEMEIKRIKLVYPGIIFELEDLNDIVN